MQETWIQSLVWEDFLAEGMAPHSPVFLPSESLWGGVGGGGETAVHWVAKSQTQLSKEAQTLQIYTGKKEKISKIQHQRQPFNQSEENKGGKRKKRPTKLKTTINKMSIRKKYIYISQMLPYI